MGRYLFIFPIQYELSSIKTFNTGYPSKKCKILKMTTHKDFSTLVSSGWQEYKLEIISIFGGNPVNVGIRKDGRGMDPIIAWSADTKEDDKEGRGGGGGEGGEGGEGGRQGLRLMSKLSLVEKWTTSLFTSRGVDPRLIQININTIKNNTNYKSC